MTAASAQLTVAQINDRLSAAVKPKAVDVWTVGGTENVEGLAEEA